MEFRYMQEQDLEQVSRIEKDIFSKPWSKNDFGKAIKDSNNIYIVAKRIYEKKEKEDVHDKKNKTVK